jgi:RNA polymerase sigma-70 factor (ECF subfamily)
MAIAEAGTDTQAGSDLLRRARAGDTEAFCQLIEPLHARLLRQAIGLCRDLHTAEDLVSETLAESWKCLPNFHATCRLSTWLYSILIHRHQKFCRRAQSRPITLASLPTLDATRHSSLLDNQSDPARTPQEFLLEAERVWATLDKVARLPDPHRRVVLLRFFEDASLADIARVLDCSIGTVKSRLHHALVKLRKMNLLEWKGDTAS